VKEKWGQFVTVTKRVSPSVAFGGSLVGAPTVGVAMKELAENAEKMSSEREKDRSGALAKDLGLRGYAGLIDMEGRHLPAGLIKYLDSTRGGTHPEFGGLHPYQLREDGRLLWFCGEHREQYEGNR